MRNQSVAHCYGDSNDKLFHCTVHYVKEGGIHATAFYLRVSPFQVDTADHAEETMATVLWNQGIPFAAMEDFSLVEVPLTLPAINHLALREPDNA